MAGMRYQPQGRAQLGTSSLARGAQGIILAGQQGNIASAVALKTSGSINVGSSPQGKVIQFRKNGYLETESLLALGTASFVEFWFGYPSSDLYASGSGGQDPGFLTGSSANMVGICGSIGSRTGGGANWGAVYNWNANQINNAGEALTPGQLTLLVVVRRQSSMDFWRNGRLVTSIAQSPVSYPAETLICGSFIENTAYWSSSSDTILAGRILGEWTADQVRSFSANPWQLFAANDEDDDYAAVVSPGITASIAWTEADDSHSTAAVVTDRAVIGWIEDNDAATLAAVITDRAQIAWAESDDVHSITGSVAAPAPVNVAGSIAWTEQDDAFSTSARVGVGGAPGYGSSKPKRRYVVHKGDQLHVFTDPIVAQRFLHADDEQPIKQYPAKKQPKPGPKSATPAETEPAPIPEQQIDLVEIRALAARLHAEAEYQRLMAQQRYEALVVLADRLRDEEEDDWLLMAAA